MALRLKSTVEAPIGPETVRQPLLLLEKYSSAFNASLASADQFASRLKDAERASGKITVTFEAGEAALSRTTWSHQRLVDVGRRVSSVFGQLSRDSKAIAENLTRAATSLLSISALTGATLGLAGLGGGLFGLDELARAATARRRTALGLGVGYGQLAAFDADFSRFGIGDQTLAAAAGGVYDVTSPAYTALMAAGVNPHGGSTADITVELLKRLPQIFANTPAGMIGPQAEALGLTQILSVREIVAYLRATPEERQAQIGRFASDSRTLNISADAQQKWANFSTALTRAGLQIEGALGERAAALAEPLENLSAAAVKVITAFANSQTVDDTLGKVQHGLEWLSEEVGSPEFKRGAQSFLSGLEAMIPVVERIMRVAGGVLRGGYYAGRFVLDPNYNPSASRFVTDVFGGGPAGADVSPGTRRPRPSLRYGQHYGPRAVPHATIGAAPGGGTVDTLAPGLIPGTDQPGATTSTGGVAGVPITDISSLSDYPRRFEQLDNVSGFIWHHTGGRGTPQSIVQTLNARGLGVQYVMDRDGKIYQTLPSGARGAHILPSEINDLSNSNTEGMEVIANDDTNVTPAQIESAKRFAEWFSKEHPGVQYFGHGEVNPHHKMATEGATITAAVRADLAQTPITTPTAYAEPSPLETRTLMNYVRGGVENVEDPSIIARKKMKAQMQKQSYLAPLRGAKTPRAVNVVDETGGAVVAGYGRLIFG